MFDASLGLNVLEFFMILSFYVLLQGCVNLIFGEDENFNVRLNPKFVFNVSKS